MTGIVSFWPTPDLSAKCQRLDWEQYHIKAYSISFLNIFGFIPKICQWQYCGQLLIYYQFIHFPVNFLYIPGFLELWGLPRSVTGNVAPRPISPRCFDSANGACSQVNPSGNTATLETIFETASKVSLLQKKGIWEVWWGQQGTRWWQTGQETEFVSCRPSLDRIGGG